MNKSFQKLLDGYQRFRKKYASGEMPLMKQLAEQGQSPEIMVVACSDSRVDPAILFQCDPGDLFMVRNVANIVPPYEVDEAHHGTSAALEFGIRFLKVKHLIILAHSHCGGIAALTQEENPRGDFIGNWLQLIDISDDRFKNPAKSALLSSYSNCLTFPWIQEQLEKEKLKIHTWYFDIETAEVEVYSQKLKVFEKLHWE